MKLTGKSKTNPKYLKKKRPKTNPKYFKKDRKQTWSILKKTENKLEVFMKKRRQCEDSRKKNRRQTESILNDNVIHVYILFLYLKNILLIDWPAIIKRYNAYLKTRILIELENNRKLVLRHCLSIMINCHCGNVMSIFIV